MQKDSFTPAFHTSVTRREPCGKMPGKILSSAEMRGKIFSLFWERGIDNPRLFDYNKSMKQYDNTL